jgi:putative adhesin
VRALLAALIVAAPGIPGRAGRQELAAGRGSASAAVAGAIAFNLRSYAADVEVVASAQDRVSVTVDQQALRVALLGAGGTRVEAEFGGKRQLHEGRLRVELPRGSSVDISTVEGRISIAGVGGNARIRGMSGEVKIDAAADVDAETVDGAVIVSGATGQVRVHTTSGAIRVEAPDPAARAEVETASGEVSLRGACGRGCHLDVDSVSGDVRFALDRGSSFSASVISTSGKVRDELSLGLRSKREAGWAEGHHGNADGLIECETFSGNVDFVAR